MKNEFEKRKTSSGLWEIYETRTRDTVTLEGGYPLSDLNDNEVVEAFDLLVAGVLTPESAPETRS